MSETVKNHPALLQVFAQRVKLEKRNDAFWGKCPFHQESSPGNSFNIGHDKKGDWVYNCFSCGASGDAVKFVQDVDKISFTEAKKILEGVTGGDWEETKQAADAVFKNLELAEESKSDRVPLEKYAKFELGLYQSPEAQEWLFRERGITYPAARQCRFGFCQTLEEVTKRYDKEKLKDIADKGWITFAAIEGDEVLCIEARSIVTKETRVRTGMTNKVLFGQEFVSTEEPLYLVEGKFDMAVMVQAGYRAISLPNASANLTPVMRDLLMSAPVLILAGDNDGASGTAKMLKMWSEFQAHTYLLTWDKKKDANQVFLETAGRDISVFRNIVDNLTLAAYSNPMPGVKSIQDILKRDESGTSEDNPNRFRFGWKSVDKMANILPGSVVYVSATQTSTGKSTWLIQASLNAARRNEEVVLNYQCEMSDSEIGEIVTANLLAKNRNEIKKEDRVEAAKRLKGVSYYVGNDPNQNGSEGVLDLIEAGVRRIGATTVVLDHLHFLCRNSSNEIQEQSRAMQRIKRMSQKYGLKFFVVGQPRKPGQKTQGKSIEIYDAKGSESIVSDSDVVFFLHREVVKNMTEETKDNLSPEVQVRCMKGRSRGKGAAFTKLFFLGSLGTFNEIVNIEPPMVQQDLF
jgi:replicative DNA helicase